MVTIPPKCQPLADEITEIEAEIRDLQLDLKYEAGPLKWAIVRQIAALVRIKNAKKVQLDACLEREGVALPLKATFNGNATLRTCHQNAPGPYSNPLSFELWFNADRTNVQILTFPPLVTPPVNTPLGSNITTIKKIGGGSGVFTPSSGAMGMPIKLLFDQSIDAWFLPDQDSTIDFLLSTTSVTSPLGNFNGSPLNAAGQITLVGESQFVGGFLGGKCGVLVIRGTISPHPTKV
jgi:hypothetical protein